MGTLTDQERTCYADVWSAIPHYGDFSPGERYLPAFLDMIQNRPRSSVIDAGCGSGKGMIALTQAGFAKVRGFDFTREGLIPEAQGYDVQECCLWDDVPVPRTDYVYCCDVLEHIPTQLTMLVVARLLRLTRAVAFFSVSFQPDVMGAWVGKALHQTVKPFTWWRDSLAAVGHLIESRDLLHSGVFAVKSK